MKKILFILIFGILAIFLVTRLMREPIYSQESWSHLEKPVIAMAIAKKDFWICKDLPDKILVRICGKGPGDCEAPETKEPVLDCLSQYIKSIPDPNACAAWKEPHCMSDVALHLKNPQLCLNIDQGYSDQHWRFLRNLCLFDVAVLIRDTGASVQTICDLMVDDEPGSTYRNACKKL